MSCIKCELNFQIYSSVLSILKVEHFNPKQRVIDDWLPMASWKMLENPDRLGSADRCLTDFQFLKQVSEFK